MDNIIDDIKIQLDLKIVNSQGWYRGVCYECNRRILTLIFNSRYGFYYNCYSTNCMANGNTYTMIKELNISVSKIDYEILKQDIKDGVHNIPKIAGSQNRNINRNGGIDTMPVGYTRIFRDSYLESRNFHKFLRYPVGITEVINELQDYKIFDVRENNKSKGWVARSILSREECDKNGILRYRNSRGKLGETLYGIDYIYSDTVYIVEGIFDKINFDYHMPGYDCVAAFGSKLTDLQCEKLLMKGVKNIIILFDRDSLEKTIKSIDKIHTIFHSVKIGILEEEDRDIGDLNKEEINKVINNSLDRTGVLYSLI